MLWILETGLTDFGYLTLIKNLERKNIPFEIVKVVPYQNILLEKDFDTFSKEPTYEDNVILPESKKIFPFGTMGLSRVAKERNWNPGSLFNSNFNFKEWSVGFGLENILNPDSIIIKIKDNLNYKDKNFFIRPCEDDKAFSGKIIYIDDFKNWQKKVLEINDKNSKLNEETEITISSIKNIINEVRLFVIDNKVITGSYYKFGNKIKYLEILNDDPVIKYAEKIMQNYEPARAYVLDIALTDKGFKIIEINNINSSGLYNSNVCKLVDAIMEKFD